MIRLLLVSDIRLYREGLAEILSDNDSVRILGTSSSIEHVLTELQHKSPDVVLVDMTMEASCEAVRHIMDTYPDIRIVALSMTEDEESILACAKVGIAGYVSREASLEQLVNTLCGVVEGELYCPRRIAARLFNKLKSLSKGADVMSDKSAPPPHDSKIATLTQREKQIASLLSDGLSNKQIARNLTIEVSTVKNHVHNILNKIGVHSRFQAVSLLQNQLSSE